MRKILLAVVCAFVLSSVAQAEITNWNYSTSVSFTGYTGGTDAVYGDANTWLDWGIPSTMGSNPDQKKSAASLVGQTGTVVTDGKEELAATITHHNYVIQNGTGITGLKFDISIALSAGEVTVPEIVLPIALKFFETPNVSEGEGYSLLSNDIFYFDAAIDEFMSSFTVDGDEYDVVVTTAFKPLDAMFNELLNSKLGTNKQYYGWTTVENNETPHDIFIKVRFEEKGEIPGTTPEPATLALLGLGALGLPLARRFRNK